MRTSASGAVLAIAFLSGAQAAIVQAEPDAPNRLWHAVTADEYAVQPENPEGCGAAQARGAGSKGDTGDDPLAAAVARLASVHFASRDPDYYTEGWQRAFSTCVMEILTPFSEEDRTYLASVGISPDRRNAERLDDAYPGFIDAMRAGAEIDPAEI